LIYFIRKGGVVQLFLNQQTNGVMKNLMLFLSTCVLIWVSALDLNGQVAYTAKSSKMQIKGTSSLHEWESDATKVSADAKIKVAAGKLEDVTSLTVTVSVKAIKSTKGKIMDDKTYEAFKADANPNIVFQLTDVESITPSGSGFSVKAKGNLSMAGSKKPISMTVTSTVASSGAVTFKGSKKLDMLDFGMVPPKALAGSIKVGPEVEIVFELSMAPSAM